MALTDAAAQRAAVVEALSSRRKTAKQEPNWKMVISRDASWLPPATLPTPICAALTPPLSTMSAGLHVVSNVKVDTVV